MSRKTVSFHRRYLAYTGGHQKVRDYMGHLLAQDSFSLRLWLENRSAIQPTLFEGIDKVSYESEYRPDLADIVFLAGMDWDDYLPFASEAQPKINLIQHVRHGNKHHPLFKFLSHRAIRLCVSEAVRQAILPHANGPCFTIRMGHEFPKVTYPKVFQLYILATKNPDLGISVRDKAAKLGLSVILHDKPVERSAVHQAMSQSLVTLALPNNTEGFYLPGIEAMALSDWAIVPDCIASREYSLSSANISVCERDSEACIAAIQEALVRGRGISGIIRRWKGRRIAQSYSLKTEQLAVQRVFQQIPSLW
ncbi:glycosyltransferase [Bowmanella pacifica]|uniref:Uncharacterized protein n=1 Tax=Bowmanella pacifica TaxID=502051 RepID=A0A917YQH3_9ALTE|nr:glycosyltransferase [Bowmanella pacifica]GGO63578.1 hypothetical protein GCM10010982_00940 [Bowmanella pacifica]